MTSQEQRTKLLNDINKQLPPGVDWKAGARRYVQHYFEKSGKEETEYYSLTKPFSIFGSDTATNEMLWYYYNFINLVGLIRPVIGAKVLDVACGGGWISHYLTKGGCKTFGIDISADFIALAKRRVLRDKTLKITEQQADAMFAVLDLEDEPLPAEHQGSFDYAILESCLHHFYDPVSAMIHLADAMKPDGIVVIIEGANLKGPLAPDWVEVMQETDTLERPYSRDHLLQILGIAGLNHVEFLGHCNGWFSPDAPEVDRLPGLVRERAEAMNLAVCSKSPAFIERLFPHRASKPPEEPSHPPQAESGPADAPPAPVQAEFVARLRSAGKAWISRRRSL